MYSVPVTAVGDSCRAIPYSTAIPNSTGWSIMHGPPKFHGLVLLRKQQRRRRQRLLRCSLTLEVCLTIDVSRPPVLPSRILPRRREHDQVVLPRLSGWLGTKGSLRACCQMLQYDTSVGDVRQFPPNQNNVRGLEWSCETLSQRNGQNAVHMVHRRYYRHPFCQEPVVVSAAQCLVEINRPFL